MPALEIRPFEEGDLDAAAVLLAARHAAHRRAEPLLSPRFESPETARAELVSVWSREGTSGAIAYAGGRPVGYLLGGTKPSGTWGPNVWVESAGFAAEEAETVRDLYAAAAQRWVDEGRTAHYALVPSHDRDVVDAWFRLAFGHQHTHALVEAPSAPHPPVAGVTVRRPRRDDIPALAALDLALPEHQALSPVFSAGSMPTLDEARADWEESFDDPDYTAYVAEVDGRVVGAAVACALGKSSLHEGLACPDEAGFLGFAAVLPAARGRGAGRALGQAVLDWTAEAGYRVSVTDWRATNLLSSRAWPRLGYRDTFLRLHRNIGY